MLIAVWGEIRVSRHIMNCPRNVDVRTWWQSRSESPFSFYFPCVLHSLLCCDSLACTLSRKLAPYMKVDNLSQLLCRYWLTPSGTHGDCLRVSGAACQRPHYPWPFSSVSQHQFICTSKAGEFWDRVKFVFIYQHMPKVPFMIYFILQNLLKCNRSSIALYVQTLLFLGYLMLQFYSFIVQDHFAFSPHWCVLCFITSFYNCCIPQK